MGHGRVLGGQEQAAVLVLPHPRGDRRRGKVEPVVGVRRVFKPPQQRPLKLNARMYWVNFNVKLSFTCKEMVVVDFGGNLRTSSSM